MKRQIKREATNLRRYLGNTMKSVSASKDELIYRQLTGGSAFGEEANKLRSSCAVPVAEIGMRTVLLPTKFWKKVKVWDRDYVLTAIEYAEIVGSRREWRNIVRYLKGNSEILEI